MSRLRWWVLAAAVVFTAFAATWGTGVFERLADDTSGSSRSESQQVVERINTEVGRTNVDFIALYSSDELTVTDPRFRDAVVEATERISDHEAVVAVTSYYDTDAPRLVSEDRHATYVLIRLVENPEDGTAQQLRDDLAADGLTTQVGGPRAIALDVGSQIPADIARAEMISLPILLVLLVLIFGGLVAASMPLLIGVLAIFGAFTLVRLLTLVTDVSIFSINLITILGLGLAIDYALFVVSRFREELDRGQEVEAAVSRTMATAGRTIAVSAVTVALALSGLLIFPQLFLRSMGLGGAAAVAVAMVMSLTVLPALLAVLGHRIDALRVPWAARRRTPTLTGAVAATVARAADRGFWARTARAVMRRPVLFAVGTTAVLLLLAMPFTRVQFGGTDERVLPPGTESRVVSERLKTEFAGGDVDPIRVLVSGADPTAAAAFAETIKEIDGVRDATPIAGRGDSTVVSVTYQGASISDTARTVVDRIRNLPEPPGAEVLVGGRTANLVDLLAGLGDRLPWMVLLVAAVTFVLLFLAFGSVVLPVKAIVMNVLSIGASFGAVVWVFQDGHLSGLLNFTPTGSLEATQPVLMLALLFGLSMDYEVFLLSRIREEWDTLGDNTAAVAAGIQRTGGIITAAALLLAVVIGGFATSGITFIKMIGLGMLVAIVVDATLVRLLLVPATMRLLGRYNWWAPPLLRGLYRRYGIRESDPAASGREPEFVPTR